MSKIINIFNSCRALLRKRACLKRPYLLSISKEIRADYEFTLAEHAQKSSPNWENWHAVAKLRKEQAAAESGRLCHKYMACKYAIRDLIAQI